MAETKADRLTDEQLGAIEAKASGWRFVKLTKGELTALLSAIRSSRAALKALEEWAEAGSAGFMWSRTEAGEYTVQVKFNTAAEASTFYHRTYELSAAASALKGEKSLG